MTDLSNPGFIVTALAGLVFIISGIILRKFPPKKINLIYGYRTRSSRRSQESWDFAQQYAGGRITFWGIVLFCISPVALLFDISDDAAAIGGLCATVLFVIIPPIIETELALKRKFDKKEI